MIPINKRNIATSIILSFVTLGIYLIYWEYLLVKNIRVIKKDESSCTGEMLCLIFVPFYAVYWWYTRGKTVKEEFAKWAASVWCVCYGEKILQKRNRVSVYKVL